MARIVCNFLHDASSVHSRSIACDSDKQKLYHLNQPLQTVTVSVQNLLECDLYCFKDGAYYCYCAYVLCIARYLGFLWVVPTNTGIF